MKKIKLICSLVVILMTVSCQKILDTKPQDFVTATTYFRNAADATSVLNAAYRGLHAQYVYGGYWLCRSLGADDIYCIYSTGYPAVFGIDANDSSGQLLPLWNGLYNMIEQCNVLLKYLPQASIDPATSNVIKGEALFLRGFCYFQLVEQWGGVPLRLQPTAGTADISLARSSVADVYKQVLADMTAAEALVPDATTSGYGDAGYPAKTTVEGILARVCLTMAGYPLNDVSKYQDAKMWCQKVISSGLHSLNPDFTAVFNNFATEILDKKEVLWEIDMSDQTGQGAYGYVGFLDGVANTSVTFGLAGGQLRCTRKLFNLYAPGVTSLDIRRDFTISNIQQYNNPAAPSLTQVGIWNPNYTWCRYANKYKIYLTPQPHYQGNSPINFPMLRYADILLMAAEADNAGGTVAPTALDYSYINKVRERGYGVGLPGVTTTAAQADVQQNYNATSFYQLIQDERGRELAEEGLRKHDLLRWGIYVSSVRNLINEVNDPAQFKIPTTDYWYNQIVRVANAIKDRDVLWPIPATELTYNKFMTQNPGW